MSNLENEREGSGLQGPAPLSFDQASFDRAWALWEGKRPEDYFFSYLSPGWARVHFRVQVRKGKVAGISTLGGSRDGFPLTIDDIFSRIATAVAAERENTGLGSRLEALSLSYDPDWGFPASVGYYWWNPPGTMVDGNSSFSICDFHPGQNDQNAPMRR